MKAVFDTNIFVSTLVFPGGRAEAAVLKAVNGDIELLISKPIVNETLEVLARKFDRNAEELARVAVFLSELGKLVSPKIKLKILSDEPDNRILECAVAGHADIIVTGDQAMLRLSEYKKVKIIALKDFLLRFE